jgi:hypothetical protein
MLKTTKLNLGKKVRYEAERLALKEREKEHFRRMAERKKLQLQRKGPVYSILGLEALNANDGDPLITTLMMVEKQNTSNERHHPHKDLKQRLELDLKKEEEKCKEKLRERTGLSL